MGTAGNEFHLRYERVISKDFLSLVYLSYFLLLHLEGA